MDIWTTIPCFMCSEIILLNEVDYYNYLGKLICKSCYESLSGGNYAKSPPVKEEIVCLIPKNIQLSDNTREICNAHQKKYQFFCNSCNLSLCLFCLPQHCSHGFSDLNLKSKEVLGHLYTLEHFIRYSINYFEDKSEELSEMTQRIVELYKRAISKTNSSIMSYLPTELDYYFNKLKLINSDLIGLSLEECRKIIDYGRDSIKELKQKNYMH